MQLDPEFQLYVQFTDAIDGLVKLFGRDAAINGLVGYIADLYDRPVSLIIHDDEAGHIHVSMQPGQA